MSEAARQLAPVRDGSPSAPGHKNLHGFEEARLRRNAVLAARAPAAVAEPANLPDRPARAGLGAGLPVFLGGLVVGTVAALVVGVTMAAPGLQPPLAGFLPEAVFAPIPPARTAPPAAVEPAFVPAAAPRQPRTPDASGFAGMPSMLPPTLGQLRL